MWKPRPTFYTLANARLTFRKKLPGIAPLKHITSAQGPNAKLGGGIAFDGDSLTYGVGAVNGTSDYPTQLMGLINGSSLWTKLINAGVAGQQLSAMESDASTEIDTLYSASYPNNILVAWGGTNDIINGVSAATIESRITTYVTNRVSAGWTVYFLTILPRNEFESSGAQVTVWNAVNTWIRANDSAVGYTTVDVQADTLIGDLGDEQGATYYDTDHIHMTAAGYTLIARHVRDALIGSFQVNP